KIVIGDALAKDRPPFLAAEKVVFVDEQLDAERPVRRLTRAHDHLVLVRIRREDARNHLDRTPLDPRIAGFDGDRDWQLCDEETAGRDVDESAARLWHLLRSGVVNEER